MEFFLVNMEKIIAICDHFFSMDEENFSPLREIMVFWQAQIAVPHNVVVCSSGDLRFFNISRDTGSELNTAQRNWHCLSKKNCWNVPIGLEKIMDVLEKKMVF